MEANPVVLFDGVCNYCNRMVNFAIRNDHQGKLRFAALQSEAGQRLVNQMQIPPAIDSVILIEGQQYSSYSTAAIRIAKYLDWPARLLFGFIIVPAFIRQPLYRWFARNRYRWFGKTEACMIPTASVRSRFLE